ncbi:MAG: GNAT family N-acetyltransferase [Clostridia bacterium]
MKRVLMEIDGLEFCSTKPEYLDLISSIEKNNSNFVFVWPKERHMEAINRVDEMHISIILASTSELVGYIILTGVGGEDQSLEFRRMVIADKGKGYGRTSVRFIKKYCFEVLKYHRLWLDSYTDNERAIGLYASEDFVQEGIIRECKRHGDGYRSMVIMSMLENEYKG